MEVHHHPHLPHGKKRFKEYLSEFVMIFLAVALGFIAENAREALSDHSREHEYVTGMVENLQDDTLQLKQLIRNYKGQLAGVDSILKVNKNNLAQVRVQDSLFVLTAHCLFYSNNFRNNQTTLTQLRNAGGYRLIRNKAVVDTIASLEARIKDMDAQYNDVYAIISTAREDGKRLLDFTASEAFNKAPYNTPVLITTDRQTIYQFYNQCLLLHIAIEGYYEMLQDQLAWNTKVIGVLRKTYDLD